MRIIYHHFEEKTEEYEVVEEYDTYYSCLTPDGVYRVVRKRNIDKPIIGVLSFDKYNEKIEKLLKQSAEMKIESLQNKIKGFTSTIETFQSHIEDHENFIEKGRMLYEKK